MPPVGFISVTSRSGWSTGYAENPSELQAHALRTDAEAFFFLMEVLSITTRPRSIITVLLLRSGRTLILAGYCREKK